MAGLAPPTQNTPPGHVAHCAVVALKNEPTRQDDDDCADTRPGPHPPPHHRSSSWIQNHTVGGHRGGCGADGRRTVWPAAPVVHADADADADGGWTSARGAEMPSRPVERSAVDARDGLGGGERCGREGRKGKANRRRGRSRTTRAARTSTSSHTG
jgi:hypothetical protein